jgi:hypothetical protein
MFTIISVWHACPPATAAADTIYFKDGMRMICHGSAHEENNEVHCEYDGGILIYPKADVLRIEKGPGPAAERITPPSGEAGQPPAPKVMPPMSKSVPPPGSAASVGILFYDPRRAKRYWSNENRHHDSYQDAIAALGEEFDKSSQWVEAHMGDSNDMMAIRANLAAGLAGTAAESDPAALYPNRVGVEFYNPRRPQKYWTGPDTRHNTFKEAVETLAVEFKKPAIWIETHMGDSNDTERIRQSLQDAANEQSSR